MAAPRARTSLPEGASAGAERCSILGTLTIVGDFWTLSVLRCAVYGMRRFGEYERELGIATNVLTDRLGRLVEADVLERVAYQTAPPRHEYLLTEAGRELAPIVLALKGWGDRHLQDDGPWTSVRHRGCEAPVEVAARCRDCGAAPALDDLETVWVRTPPGGP